MTITRELYEAFQCGELDRWNRIIDADVEIFSPGMWGERGLEKLKTFANEFLTALSPRIDLVDEFDGGHRAFVTFCMHWRHVAPFFGIAPTGRQGTSIETLLLTIGDGRIVRLGVADNTLDLAIYLWERGFPQRHNVNVPAIVRGIERCS
jgi:hypothetical protein